METTGRSEMKVLTYALASFLVALPAMILIYSWATSG